MSGPRGDLDPSVRQLLDERDVLGRVALLVARGGTPGEVFATVCTEVSRLFGSQAAVARFEAGTPAMSVVGVTPGIPGVSVGTRWELEDFLASSEVYRTGRAARRDHVGYPDESGPAADSLNARTYVSTVAAPIVVEGSLWGVLVVSDERNALPVDTEQRVANFTELVATAIASAAGRAELSASEARAHDLAREQAALRRVATLVGEGPTEQKLFAAVAHEVADVVSIPVVALLRFEDDRTLTMVGVAGSTSFTVGSRWPVEDDGLAGIILATGRPARKGDYSTMAGPVGAAVRDVGMVATVGVPIVVEGSVWGFIVGLVKPGQRVPDSAEERLTRFTELLATAIANSLAREHLAQLATEQTALRRVATLVARDAPASELFSAVTTEVGSLLGADFSGMLRLEPDSTLVTTAATWAAVGEHPPIPGRWTSVPGDPMAIAAETRKPARLDDWTGVPGSMPELVPEGVKCSVGCPIVVKDRVWGALGVHSKRGPFPPDTEGRLLKFTELVATAIANAASRAELSASEARAHDLAREQAALRRVATLVGEGPSPQELFAAVTEEVADVVSIPVVAVLRFDEDRTVTMVGVAGGTSFTVGSRWPVEDDGLAGMILATGRAARKDGYPTMPGPVGAAVRDGGMVAKVAVPIVVEGSIWGFIVGLVEPGERVPDAAEERLTRFTELLATAIANGRTREHLGRLATEQAALRRVATLVARESPPLEVFGAVTDEAIKVLGVKAIGLLRFESDRTATLVAQSETPWDPPPLGTQFRLDGDNLVTALYRTGRSTRDDEWRNATGDVSAMADVLGIRSSVAVPIVVERRLWGTLIAPTNEPQPLPPDTEERLFKFTELVATAIANTESRTQLAASEATAQNLAREQAALRRVATLVAEGATAEKVLTVVAEEVEEVLDLPAVTICRCDADGFLVIRSRGMPGFPAGSRWPWDLPSLPRAIYETGRPSRIDDFTDAEGLNAAAREAGVKGALGVPIAVAGTLWGSICAATTRNEPLPPDMEQRLGQFRDLIATAISNAVMREELAASRARVIASADDARRRIERDLHDGAQQRLVTLAVALRRLESKTSGGDAVRADLNRIADGLGTALEELRELSRGIHPAVLSEGGLSPALKALGRRAAIHVKLEISFEHRLPDRVEVAAYYTVSEALTNAARHAQAATVWICLDVVDHALRLSVRDNGVGGADASRGSGLTGLMDRIDALGGTLAIESEHGRGTRIEVEIPLGEAMSRQESAGKQDRAAGAGSAAPMSSDQPSAPQIRRAE